MADELADKLKSLQGVSDVTTSHESSSKEVQFGYSFYGLEARRLLRNGDEIKVMLRYPQAQRNAISPVSDVLIPTAQGGEVPLSELADIVITEGLNSIRRENGQRTASVWAAVDAAQVEPLKLEQDIRDNFIPALLKKYPSVQSRVAGRIQEEIDSVNTQIRRYADMQICRYAILHWLCRLNLMCNPL